MIFEAAKLTADQALEELEKAQRELVAFESILSTETVEAQEKVRNTADEIMDVVGQNGDEGVLALALVGATMAVTAAQMEYDEASELG